MENINDDLYLNMIVEEEEEEEESGEAADKGEDTTKAKDGAAGKTWQELAGVNPKDFDTPEKLATSYKEARTELTTQGEKIKEALKFRETAEPVLKILYQDPELFEAFKKSVAKRNGTKTDDKTDKTEDDKLTTVVEDPEVKGELTQIIVDKFEDRHNISKLKDEDRKKVQKDIGTIMARLYPDGTPPIGKLSSLMESAWEIYEAQGIKKELGDKAPQIIGGSNGFGTPRTSQSASDDVSIDSLSPEQRRAAEKMGIALEDYARELSEIKKGK